MFNNKLKKDSVVEAVEKIIETKKDDAVDVPWKSGIGVERKHTPRTDKQDMSAAHNAVGKGLKKAKTMSKEDFSFKDQLIENHKSKQFEIELIDEKEMSPAQSKKKEEIVLSMKDREKEFKAKYGKRWKEVMYATATKMAMKEETLDEKWDDDDEDDDVKRADAELKRMKAKPIHADKKTDPDKEIGKLAKKTPKEVDESVEQIDELSKKTLGNYMRSNTKRMADPKNKDSMEKKMKRHDDYFKASKKFHEEVIYEAKGPETDNVPFVQNANPSSNTVTPLSRAKDLAHSAMKRIKNEMLGKAGATSEEIDPNVKSTDMLRGRVKGGKKDDVGPGADGKSTKVKFTPGPK